MFSVSNGNSNSNPPFFKVRLVTLRVGFIEGDAPRGFYSNSASKRLYFKIRQKDPKILHMIRSFFGFGSVTQQGDGYWTYNVSSIGHIKVLSPFGAGVLNGKLVFNHTNQRFKEQWIDPYNLWNPTTPIVYLGPAQFMGLANAWLCGFTLRHADGSLGFKLQKRGDNNRYRLRLYWYVDQTFEKELLTHMIAVLGFGFLEPKVKSKSSYPSPNSVFKKAFRLKTDSIIHCQTLRNYFDQYPVRSL
uniref:Protosiphon botryoides mitochondrial cytochrome b oxidase subunit I and intronic ORF, partial and n=1 Tax=Protosiphon botryoides TaxID=44656 RepID=V9H143_PROBT|nr:unnamed protein product [Protosiphon botryoides]